jgi:NADPH-dependent curcumin reductase
LENNHQVLLKSRPAGMPTLDNFEYVSSRIPKAGKDEILVRNLYLSLDPYMRGRMDDTKSYVPSVAVGGVMVGHTAGEVLESNDPRFQVGDFVVGYGHWQEYAVLSTSGPVRKLDPAVAPISTALGVLGMPGRTAWIGLVELASPKPNETVVVSAAAGAVGSVVGQIAKMKQCRVVGIAGGSEKCRYVVDELGFDACVDHRSPSFAEDLVKACPRGIDINFENVGGKVLEAVWPLLNDFARVTICGLVAEYNDKPPPGPELHSLLTRRISVRGFVILDYVARTQEYLDQMTPWVREGKIKYREHIVDGLENAPGAFIGMLNGKNFGKQIVRIANS